MQLSRSPPIQVDTCPTRVCKPKLSFFYCLKRALNCALAAAGVGGVENISIQGPTNWTVNCVIIYFIYLIYLLVLSYVSDDKNIDWLCNCN